MEYSNTDIMARIASLETTLLNRLVVMTEKLDSIEKVAFAAVPKSRRTKKIMEAEPGSERALREARETAVFNMFNTLAGMGRLEKGRYLFNFRIIQADNEEPWEIVPVSTLRNRLQQRGVFSRAADQIDAIIDRLVLAGHFEKMPLCEAAVMSRLGELEAFRKPSSANAMMLVSREEAEKIAAAKEAEKRLPRKKREVVQPTEEEEEKDRRAEMLARFEAASPEERARMSRPVDPKWDDVVDDSEPLEMIEFDMSPRSGKPAKKSVKTEDEEEAEYQARREAATRAQDAEAEAALETQITKTKPWGLQK